MESFSISGSQLARGASLGNSAVWIQTKGDGAIERIFLNSISESLVGTVNLRYAGQPERTDSFFSGIFAGGPRTLEIHPVYQRVTFSLIEVIDVSETTFLPLAKGDPSDDEPVLYVIVELRNRDSIQHELRVVASAMLCGNTLPDVCARYDSGARALVAHNASRPEWTRVLAHPRLRPISVLIPTTRGRMTPCTKTSWTTTPLQRATLSGGFNGISPWRRASGAAFGSRLESTPRASKTHCSASAAFPAVMTR